MSLSQSIYTDIFPIVTNEVRNASSQTLGSPGPQLASINQDVKDDSPCDIINVRPKYCL